MLADSHLHLFSPGYVATLPESCRRLQPDELTLYEAYRSVWNIPAALVVGYEDDDAYRGNNAYLASLVRQYTWLKPVAFTRPSQLTVKQLYDHQAAGFVGISVYLFGDDATGLDRVPEDAWRWLVDHHALVSVNARGESWLQWRAVLDRHPQLRVLISHMGLPGRWACPPDVPTAEHALDPVLLLASYPKVHVKLSGFYAVSEPGHDYPHEQASPILELLAGTYGPSRLLWGSDFSPCLEYVSFPQTLGPIDRWTRLTDEDRARIKGGNLLGLLREGGFIA